MKLNVLSRIASEVEAEIDNFPNAFPPRRREVPTPSAEPAKVFGFLTDTSLCIGCKACEVACKQWNQLPADGNIFTGNSYDNSGHLSATTWRHVTFKEKIGGPLADVMDDGIAAQGKWLMMSDVCKHCEDAPCLKSCPTGALIYNPFGDVYVQADICNGCGYCISACPFGVLGRSEIDGHAHKCTLCFDRQADGMVPACAKACPTESIKFGPLEELWKSAEKRVEVLHARGSEGAYLYGKESIGDYGRLNAFFILEDHPNDYNLPEEPRQADRGQAKRYATGLMAFVGLVAAAATLFAGAARRTVAPESPPLKGSPMPAPTRMIRPSLEPGVSPSVTRRHTASAPADDHSYYDVSILKPPVWRWQIASYFFFGGVSAGAYALARVAERFGGREFRYVAKIGTYTACAAAIPCPILLIWDLGDASRFHHMLRIFNPASAMSLGTWVLTSLTPIAYGAAFREFLTDTGFFRKHPRLNIVAESIGVVSDAVGIPLALLLGTYTGVLLSNTANPIWCQNRWLAPLFAIGSFSTGVTAISLIHDLQKGSAQTSPRAKRALKTLDTLGHIAESVAFEGYLRSLGPQAAPFTTGSQRIPTRLARAGLIAAEVLKHIPAKPTTRRRLSLLSAIVSLTSAFVIRWTIVHGAHESANDPAAARRMSKTRDPRLQEQYRRATRTIYSPAESSRATQPDAISTLDPEVKENPRHR